MEKTMVIIPWAENKEEFAQTVKSGDWHITKDNELIDDLQLENDDSSYEIKESFYSGTFPAVLLKEFCMENHPEVDFDSEFETHREGVFRRYKMQFGYDYQEWFNNRMYEMLQIKLNKIGYELPWE